MDIALISFALAIACLWGARRSRDSAMARTKFYWAGMCLMAVGFGGGYLQVLEWRSPIEVAQFVPPYPCATVLSRSPIPVDNARAWTFETRHSPKSVAEFYAKMARTNGWEMKREAATNMEVLVLRQLEN